MVHTVMYLIIIMEYLHINSRYSHVYSSKPLEKYLDILSGHRFDCLYISLLRSFEDGVYSLPIPYITFYLSIHLFPNRVLSPHQILLLISII